MIDLSKVNYHIKSHRNQFAILIRYKSYSFYIYKGDLQTTRKKFISIVNNPIILKPILEHYFNHYVRKTTREGTAV
ncbi:hypothetical protein D1B32_11910 [Oceanobacillus profundus]|uniref:Uncharacterized protein n=1 Tax=Oceanobacillus profundus TaxID=372463 RepID=A0A417YGJ0_9BACI|nr:hypothetical protein [Bacilli bacterium]RHW31937.1 hypothetical protein D1B32_11910 [Oceanobacillus profundus]